MGKYVSSSSSSSGVGFFGLISVVLMTLKLLGHIDISWFWVFAPVFIPGLIFIFILLCVIGWFTLEALFKRKKK